MKKMKSQGKIGLNTGLLPILALALIYALLVAGCGEVNPTPFTEQQRNQTKFNLTDTDQEKGTITGAVTLTLPDSFKFTGTNSLALSWADTLPSGSGASAQPQGTLITDSITVTNGALTNGTLHTFDAGTEIKGRYILLYQKSDKPVAAGLAYLYSTLKIEVEDKFKLDSNKIDDKGATLSFTDEDRDENALQGEVAITFASDPSGFEVEAYQLYWGNGEEEGAGKALDTPISEINKNKIEGNKLVLHTFAENSFKNGDFLTVYTTTIGDDGKTSYSGLSLKIDDIKREFAKELDPATYSMSFEDKDGRAGKLEGNVLVAPIFNLDDLTLADELITYWSHDGKNKADSPAIATLSKDLLNTIGDAQGIATFPEGAAKVADFLILVLKNGDGEKFSGLSVKVEDFFDPSRVVPDNLQGRGIILNFRDQDMDEGIQGQVTLDPLPADELIEDYLLYWSQDGEAKLEETPIAKIPKASVQGISLYEFPENTVPKADFIVLALANDVGETMSGLATAVKDLSLPSVEGSKGRLIFIDEDIHAGEIEGRVALDLLPHSSKGVQSLSLYWSPDGVKKSDTAMISSVARADIKNNVIHAFGEDTPLIDNFLLLYYGNEAGEIFSGQSIAIKDVIYPQVPFSMGVLGFEDKDTDYQEVEGQVSLDRIPRSSTIEELVLYWSQDGKTKSEMVPAGKVQRTSIKEGKLVYLGANTKIAGDYLLLYLSNRDGEINSGAKPLMIKDLATPSTSISGQLIFIDEDQNRDELAGRIVLDLIPEGVDEYTIYWSPDGKTTLLADYPLAKVKQADVKNNVLYTLEEDSTLIDKYLILTLSNHVGESKTAASVKIEDLIVLPPTEIPGTLIFVDEDPKQGSIGGRVAFDLIPDSELVDELVLYWSDDGKTKADPMPLAEINKADIKFNQLHVIPEGSPIKSNSILLFLKNFDGESNTGISVAVKDIALPPSKIYGSLILMDQDLDQNQVQGNLVLDVIPQSDLIQDFALYWSQDGETKDFIPFAKVNKSMVQNNVLYAFPENTPMEGSHIILALSNADGEVNGTSLKVTDEALPQTPIFGSLVFVDEDFDETEIEGTLVLDVLPKSDLIEDLVLYWSDDGLRKLNAEPFTEMKLSDVGRNVLHVFGPDSLMTGSHVLLYLRNSTGEVYSHLSLQLEDDYVPQPAPLDGELVFEDNDFKKGSIGGDLVLSPVPATDDFDQYMLYWVNPDDATDRTLIAAINKGELIGDLLYQFPDSTPLPEGALLELYLRNQGYETPSELTLVVEDAILGGSDGPNDGSNNGKAPVIGKVENVNFDFDKYEVAPEYRQALLEKFESLKGDKTLIRLKVAGHADPRGSNEYNLALGQRRADAVKAILVTLGVPMENLLSISYGEEVPFDENAAKGEETYSKDRRTETSQDID